MSYSLLTARAATILMVRILVLIVIIAGFVFLICYAAPPEANASLRNSVQTLLEAGKTVLITHQRRGGTVSVEFGSSATALPPMRKDFAQGERRPLDLGNVAKNRCPTPPSCVWRLSELGVDVGFQHAAM